jgi:hypothetical protein
MSVTTISERLFEQWCREQRIEQRRVRTACVEGHQRPDYAMRMPRGWCIVEVKQIEANREDRERVVPLRNGTLQPFWANPGARLRKPIVKASSQLQRFSLCGFPTVVLLFDTTGNFHTEMFQVIQAILGEQSLRIEVSADFQHEPQFLGVFSGKKATLTAQHNTSVSAVAVLRQPSGSPLAIDLCRNRFARIPILPEEAAPFVQHQIEVGTEPPHHEGPSIFDLKNDLTWQDWLAEPEGMCEREIKNCLRGFGEKTGSL